MATLNLQIAMRKRWFFMPAVIAGLIALRLGIIRPKLSPEYVGGLKPADHRVARWIVDRCMVLTVG